MNKIVKDAMILTVITLIAGLCLGFVYEVTKNPIKETNAKAKQEAYKEVFKDAASFEEDDSIDLSKAASVLKKGGYASDSIDEALAAKDSSGETIGYVMTITAKEGYGGDITFTMGVKSDGTVNGISFLSISETAGLGMKANEPAFKDQFKDKKVEKFEYTKSGAKEDNQIDALSGATITTNAVTNGVDAGLLYFQEIGGGSANE